jgi:hypothetical protein
MKPVRTEHTENIIRLPGGTEENDLPFYEMEVDGIPVVCSVWELSAEERAAIAKGENVRLIIWGRKIPPVAIDLSDEEIKR